MSFKHNGTKFYLLTNKPVIFSNEETKENFEICLPTLELIYTNEDLIFLVNLLDNDLKEVQKLISIKIESHYDFIHLVCSLSSKNKDFKELSEKILKALKLIIKDIEFNSVLKINNIIITPEIFEMIFDVILLSFDKEVERIKSTDDEFTKMEKAARIRAQTIRKNSKTGRGLLIEDILAAILYEFPQYKLLDLMQMNLYTIYYLFKNASKIANYEVSKIAAGNGLAKKHKYFIEK